jgi:hypothetical protein
MGVNINEDRERTAYEASRPAQPQLNHFLWEAFPTLAAVSALAGVPMRVFETSNMYQVFVQDGDTEHLPVNSQGVWNYKQAIGYHGGEYYPKLRGVVVAVRAYAPTGVLAGYRYN